MSREEDEISYATNKKSTIKLKFVFVGDQNVGKSSIITRFIKNEFNSTHYPTVGIDFISKNLVVFGKSLRLQLWDTAGQERFRSLIPSYLRDCHAALLVIDLTNAETLKHVGAWIDFIKESRGQDAFIYAVGNKNDVHERVINQQTAKNQFAEMGIPYGEVSAKTGSNLNQMFDEICSKLLNAGDFSVTNFNLPKETISGQKKRQKGQQNDNSTKESTQKVNQNRNASKLKHPKSTVVMEKNCC